MKRIGILAGMGPRSTAPFLELVLDEAKKDGAIYDIDYPHMLIYSLPTPFYLDRPINHDAMKAALSIGIKALIDGGVDMLTIPCNSAHVYYEYIVNEVTQYCIMSEKSPIPVLHIVDEALNKLPSKAESIALLATPSTIESQIYHHKLASLGVPLVHNSALQADVTLLITTLKQQGFSMAAKEIWEKIKTDLQQECRYVLVACTDITPCLKEETSDTLHFIDTSKTLAESTYRKYLEINKAPSVSSSLGHMLSSASSSSNIDPPIQEEHKAFSLI